jgi:hypothetical protein
MTTEQLYRDFAAFEATGRSPLYVELSLGVAADRELRTWLDGLPRGKRQPNLLFAAHRLVCGTPSGWEAFRAGLAERRGEVEAVMLERRTQTNEAARCALHLPVLARLPQPLALLEVGASAGLCLQPDRYGYDYGGHVIGDGMLRCAAEGDVPLPDAPPEVVWRAGLDIHPLDVGDDEQMRWLELLVWPGQEQRLATLRRAVEIARRDPPPVIQGDLATGVPALAAEAPEDATLVIFHTAVLGYVPRASREAFRAALGGARWLACEPPALIGLAKGPPSRFAVALDGRRLGWGDPHGARLSWG